MRAQRRSRAAPIGIRFACSISLFRLGTFRFDVSLLPTGVISVPFSSPSRKSDASG